MNDTAELVSYHHKKSRAHTKKQKNPEGLNAGVWKSLGNFSRLPESPDEEALRQPESPAEMPQNIFDIVAKVMVPEMRRHQKLNDHRAAYAMEHPMAFKQVSEAHKSRKSHKTEGKAKRGKHVQ